MFKLKTSENAFTVAYRGGKESKCGHLRTGRVTQPCHQAQALSASLFVSLVMSVTLPHHVHVPDGRQEKRKKHQDISSHTYVAGDVSQPRPADGRQKSSLSQMLIFNHVVQ